MSLCLDSNVLIDLMRGRIPHLRDRLEAARTSGQLMFLSAIVLHELVYGALRSARPDHHLDQIDELTQHMRPEPWAPEDAMEAARLRSDLANVGTSIGAYDLMLAAQARRREWTVVTANLREFARVDGLRLLDWSDPAGPRELTGGMARFAQRLKRD